MAIDHLQLIQACSDHPDHPALCFENKTLSYAELKQCINTLAQSLLQAGIQPGDRIAFQLYNCPELIFIYYAAFAIGAIAVPINYRLKADEIKTAVDLAEPKILISENSLFSEISKIRDQISIEQYYLTDWQPKPFENTQPLSSLLKMQHDSIKLPEINPQSIAIIHFTSGSTETPKAVTFRLEQLQLIAKINAQHLQYHTDDNILVCLSLAHSFSFSMQLLPTLYAGGTLTLLPSFDAKQVLATITQQGITGVCLLPALCTQLLNHTQKMEKPSQQLRYCIVAGDAMPMAVHESFQQCFGIRISEDYGCTEAPLISMNPLTEQKKIGSVGLPIPQVEIAIMDNHDNTLSKDEIGEIVVRTPTMTAGYWQNTELTQQSIQNGWLHTGDLGCIDHDGFLWFRGRLKQLIVRGGSNIAPQEVEAALYQHPAVLEAAVIGIPNPDWGETVNAYVALKSGAILDEAELTAFAKERLANYKVPEKIYFLKSLPKRGVGKIDRRQLRSEVLSLSN